MTGSGVHGWCTRNPKRLHANALHTRTCGTVQASSRDLAVRPSRAPSNQHAKVRLRPALRLAGGRRNRTRAAGRLRPRFRYFGTAAGGGRSPACSRTAVRIVNTQKVLRACALQTELALDLDCTPAGRAGAHKARQSDCPSCPFVLRYPSRHFVLHASGGGETSLVAATLVVRRLLVGVARGVLDSKQNIQTTTNDTGPCAI